MTNAAFAGALLLALGLIWAGSSGRAVGEGEAGFAVFSAVLSLVFTTGGAFALAAAAHG